MRILKGLLVSLILMSMLLPNLAFAKDTAKVAKILEVSGDVKVKKGGGEKEFKAFKNMGLTQGDTIITGRDGRTRIAIDKDKEVAIASDTKLVISELVESIKAESGKTSINLLGGKVMVNVNTKLKGDSKFEIKTPTAVMGVRGTYFFVGFDPSTGTSDVGVFEGQVVARPAASKPDQAGGQSQDITIKPNQQVSMDATTKPEEAKVEEIKPGNLDLFILQEIKDNGDRVDDKNLQNIDEIIKEKEKEEANKPKEEPKEEQPPQIVHEDPAQPPSNGSNNTPSETKPELKDIVITGLQDIMVDRGGYGVVEYQINPSNAKVEFSYSPSVDPSKIQTGSKSGGGFYWKVNDVQYDFTVTVKASKSGYYLWTSSFKVSVKDQTVNNIPTIDSSKQVEVTNGNTYTVYYNTNLAVNIDPEDPDPNLLKDNIRISYDGILFFPLETDDHALIEANKLIVILDTPKPSDVFRIMVCGNTVKSTNTGDVQTNSEYTDSIDLTPNSVDTVISQIIYDGYNLMVEILDQFELDHINRVKNDGSEIDIWSEYSGAYSVYQETLGFNSGYFEQVLTSGISEITLRLYFKNNNHSVDLKVIKQEPELNDIVITGLQDIVVDRGGYGDVEFHVNPNDAQVEFSYSPSVDPSKIQTGTTSNGGFYWKVNDVQYDFTVTVKAAKSGYNMWTSSFNVSVKDQTVNNIPTIDSSKRVEITNGNIFTIYYTTDLAVNMDEEDPDPNLLKDNIRISYDGILFFSLETQDQVRIDQNRLIVTLANPKLSDVFKIKVIGNTLKNPLTGDVQTNNEYSDSIDLSPDSEDNVTSQIHYYGYNPMVEFYKVPSEIELDHINRVKNDGSEIDIWSEYSGAYSVYEDTIGFNVGYFDQVLTTGSSDITLRLYFTNNHTVDLKVIKQIAPTMDVDNIKVSPDKRTIFIPYKTAIENGDYSDEVLIKSEYSLYNKYPIEKAIVNDKSTLIISLQSYLDGEKWSIKVPGNTLKNPNYLDDPDGIQTQDEITPDIDGFTVPSVIGSNQLEYYKQDLPIHIYNMYHYYTFKGVSDANGILDLTEYSFSEDDTYDDDQYEYNDDNSDTVVVLKNDYLKSIFDITPDEKVNLIVTMENEDGLEVAIPINVTLSKKPFMLKNQISISPDGMKITIPFTTNIAFTNPEVWATGIRLFKVPTEYGLSGSIAGNEQGLLPYGYHIDLIKDTESVKEYGQVTVGEGVYQNNLIISLDKSYNDGFDQIFILPNTLENPDNEEIQNNIVSTNQLDFLAINPSIRTYDPNEEMDSKYFYIYNLNGKTLEKIENLDIPEALPLVVGTDYTVYYNYSYTSIYISGPYITSNLIDNTINLRLTFSSNETRTFTITEQRIPTIQSTQLSDDGKVITLTYSVPIKDCNCEDDERLKDRISLTREGYLYLPLEDKDQVTIDENKIIITLDKPLKGNYNQVRVNGEAIMNTETEDIQEENEYSDVIQMNDGSEPQISTITVDSEHVNHYHSIYIGLQEGEDVYNLTQITVVPDSGDPYLLTSGDFYYDYYFDRVELTSTYFYKEFITNKKKSLHLIFNFSSDQHNYSSELIINYQPTLEEYK